MKRLALALLAATLVVGAVLLLRPQRSDEVPTPKCGDGSPCRTVAPLIAEPIATFDVPPLARAETPAAEPSPGGSADGVVRREDADRLLAEGKTMEGIIALRKVVEADPSAKNHGDLGNLLYRLTAFDEAAVHLRAAAELDPGKRGPLARSRQRVLPKGQSRGGLEGRKACTRGGARSRAWAGRRGDAGAKRGGRAAEPVKGSPNNR